MARFAKRHNWIITASTESTCRTIHGSSTPDNVLGKGRKAPGATIMRTLTSNKSDHMPIVATMEPRGRRKAETHKIPKIQRRNAEQVAQTKALYQ